MFLSHMYVRDQIVSMLPSDNFDRPLYYCVDSKGFVNHWTSKLNVKSNLHVCGRFEKEMQSEIRAMVSPGRSHLRLGVY